MNLVSIFAYPGHIHTLPSQCPLGDARIIPAAGQWLWDERRDSVAAAQRDVLLTYGVSRPLLNCYLSHNFHAVLCFPFNPSQFLDYYIQIITVLSFLFRLPAASSKYAHLCRFQFLGY